jgi:hypothetical protein
MKIDDPVEFMVMAVVCAVLLMMCSPLLAAAYRIATQVACN